jgi:hypothetical protein
MERFRSLYGASPLHLLAVIASFAIAGYGFLRIFDSPAPESTMLFFIAAVFAHDLIAFPLYSALNQIAFRSAGKQSGYRLSRQAVQPLNYIRVPFVLSAFCLLLFFPLIFRLSSERFMAGSGQSADVFLGRWLGIVAVLFTASALLYAFRLRQENRRLAADTAARASGD